MSIELNFSIMEMYVSLLCGVFIGCIFIHASIYSDLFREQHMNIQQ